MQWQLILALAVIVPIILIPVVFVWYLNLSGIYAAIRERRAARERNTVETEATQAVAVTAGKGQGN